MVRGGVCGRRFAAGVVAVLVAGLGVVACSDPGGGAAASATPSVAASASATVEASASASAPGEVTAESLSDEELGYIVTSIPDDLTPAQEEALVAFAAFDRFTWSVWFSPAQPGVRIAGAEEYITEDAVPTLQGSYDALDPGEYLTGPVRVAVLSVDVQDVYMPATANVVTCMDRAEVRAYDSSGQDITRDTTQGRFEYQTYLSTIEGTWKATGDERLSTNE